MRQVGDRDPFLRFPEPDLRLSVHGAATETVGRRAFRASLTIVVYDVEKDYATRAYTSNGYFLYLINLRSKEGLLC